MRIRNPRDFWAGAIYLVLAIVVLWIGRGYPQGSSARMGPGYFPTALGSILAVFGAVSIGRSFIRDRVTIGALAWRPLVMVLGSVVLFGLLLNGAGVIVALTVLIVVSAMASQYSRIDVTSVAAVRRPHRLLRAGLRQGPWRADAADRHLVRRLGATDGRARQSCARLPDGDEPVESALLPDRGVPRHRGRRAARHRPDRDDRHAAADHLRPAAGLGADHAVRHLLRRAVRRLDHRDPDQPPGRIGIGGDRARRLQDGAPGQGRAWRSRPPRSARSSPAPCCDGAGRPVRAAAG